MKWFFLFFPLLFSTLCLAAPEIRGTPQDLRGLLHPAENIVTIHGSAEETAYSDRAIVSLIVTTEEELLSDAISANHRLRSKLHQSLTEAGIKGTNIKSSKFSSSPQYGWMGKKPKSYKVVNRITISINEENQLHSIAQLTDQNREVEIANTAFEHSEKRLYNKKVKSKALQDILEQKEDYEKALGVQLTPVGIRGDNIHYRATEGAMAVEEVVVTAARISSASAESDFFESGQGKTFDEVIYEAELSVDFRVRPQP
ncbi:SIMPL domain-containing protein [Microbulbifer sp. THAF38]|uniref:SIMPL domain-containing protein n=1 Tax=Microbulbifer sp. THAF38 TaxID=2587856 RepID=UPI001268BE99|nr:SIMPL domain-containing protein [Microbulbifer sp. THAF38]QFT55885.1 oxidative stress defense protein [Microbulbifer sp. THAF38]